jgi:RNA polymerase sigma-70 factor (ECF subfamily)
LLAAWSAHEAELRRYLRHCLADPDEADDLLHDLFLKACRQGEAFCAVSSPAPGCSRWRATPSSTTSGAGARRCRCHPISPPPSPPSDAPVDQLAQCLPRVLAELSPEDREAVSLCDLGGMSQAAFAELKGLSLPGPNPGCSGRASACASSCRWRAR